MLQNHSGKPKAEGLVYLVWFILAWFLSKAALPLATDSIFQTALTSQRPSGAQHT